MNHPYNEIYLNDTMRNLSAFFDIATNALGLEPDNIATRFSLSRIASGIENGNPNYLSGKSATEMLIELLQKDIICNTIPLNRSPEYWAGWVLAYAQWYLNKSFYEILNVMPFSKLVSLYHPYHEAPEMKTVELIQSRFFFLSQSVREQSIPFEISREIPNKKTIDAYKEVEDMELHPKKYMTYTSVDTVIDDIVK